ncbi:DUF881 domain-containing protein [Modestobacter roseus]|uniref:Uncharacterized protein YlxW (UPF0749 family) n=1 Tax=Modestobacter roseus TaxID=1181884 RepID=A0A562IT72_9ACTN|nr:DUF881 domain-containing protein [Modestobacter roseus]MQA32602.1 DUF881 domain-containing protein [Modestobacter roseus]TWH73754.1 uncharacterized protein YlxW (UPF0749 family) [Modestobacter roseus]
MSAGEPTGPSHDAGPEQTAPADEAGAVRVDPAANRSAPGQTDPDRSPPAGEPAGSEPGGDVTGGDETGPVSPAGPERARQRRRRRLVLSVVTGALALALGLGMTLQIRISNTDDPLSTTTEEDLVTILNDIDANEDLLRQQLAETRRTVDELTSDRSEADSALEQAVERSQAVDVLTGAVPVRGPGIRLSIVDPEEEVDAALLLEAVQELRGAGAEAIQVNGVRVVVSTALVDGADGVRVDGELVTGPYTVLAIGPGEEMIRLLSVPGGVLSDVARADGTARVVEQDDVAIDALVGDPLDD